jgi:hypothetical protein
VRRCKCKCNVCVLSLGLSNATEEQQVYLCATRVCPVVCSPLACATVCLHVLVCSPRPVSDFGAPPGAGGRRAWHRGAGSTPQARGGAAALCTPAQAVLRGGRWGGGWWRCVGGGVGVPAGVACSRLVHALRSLRASKTFTCVADLSTFTALCVVLTPLLTCRHLPLFCFPVTHTDTY